jgi:threonine/homoserine/homoserine lactone efflux protein
MLSAEEGAVVGQGISEILTFAVGVAISPVPIVAVILMLFSPRARVNGPVFLLGWVVSLAVVSVVVYTVSHDGDVAATSSTASDSVSWGKIALGVLLLSLARRNWRKRPAKGEEPEMPRWLSTVETVSPPKAFGFAVVLAAVNPKNLVLTAGAAAGLAQVPGLSTSDAVVAIVVFVAIASLGILVPVLYALLGGDRAKATLDAVKEWLTEHNAAVLTVLFLVFGVDLIAKGLPPLTS